MKKKTHRQDVELRESEALYRTLVETSPDSIIMYALNGEILAANSQTARMYGASNLAEFHSEVKTVFDLLPEEGRASAAANLNRVLKEGSSQKNEYLTRIRGGRTLDVEINSSVVRTAEGEPRAFISVIRDITERKEAEKALREIESRFKLITDNVTDTIWIADLSFKGVWMSPSSRNRGYSLEEINALPLEKQLTPESMAVVEKIISEELTPERLQQKDLKISRKVELEFYKRDGSTFWNELNLQLLRDSQGNPAGILGVGRDITERRRTEEALRENEARYRQLVSFAPAGIYEVDFTSRRFLTVNDVMCRLTGYTREEFLSMDPLALLAEESRPEFIDRLSRLLSGEQVPGGVEYRIVGKDGRKGWALLNTRYSFRPDNRITGMVVAHDISERKQAEIERIELERRLLDAQRLESLGVLAGGIAHDFNNLLMAILGNLDMALLNISPLSSARLTIEQAVQATRRATDLTRQLLAYSGKGHFMIVPMDLNELVRENAELFRTVIHRGVTMELRLTPERACVEADPGQVQQIIMNLITNASEAIGERPGKIGLSTGVQDCSEAYLSRSRIVEKPPAGRYAYVEVGDNGQGMDEETIHRIFDPFFTTKFTGRGLGMSAVLGIVRGHRGGIIIESGRDQGTTIRVLFPAHECDACADRIPVPSAGAAGAELSGTVLVVDDEEMIRAVCTDMLRHIGFKAMSASDGEEALMMIREHSEKIALVILDLTMPRMDGLRTFQELKKLRPDMKVILCSGYSEQDATKRFPRLGLDGFIQKPFQMKELKEKVADLLKEVVNPS